MGLRELMDHGRPDRAGTGFCLLPFRPAGHSSFYPESASWDCAQKRRCHAFLSKALFQTLDGAPCRARKAKTPSEEPDGVLLYLTVCDSYFVGTVAIV